MRHEQSHALFQQAQAHIPGGVNSPVRAFRGVGGEPVFFERGEGAHLWDVDGNRYIDYVASWGPMINGHNHPDVVRAVQEQAARSLGFGAPTAIEVEMADSLCRLVPSMDKVRMVSSGTEATMSAIRLARGYTGRDKLVKFEGCYHGHADSLLVKAGSGALTLGVPTSPGVPADLAQHTINLPYNDLAAVEACFTQFGYDIAAIIVEPIAGNMNCVPPERGFLEGLRAICDHYESVLIFDEVMTGFRVALGGAQALYGVTPDLTTLGKVVGGGLPVGAFGGRAEIMDYIAPLGPVYQAGTLSGNPVAMAAGLANLRLLEQRGVYEGLAEKTLALSEGMQALAEAAGIPFRINVVPGMFGWFFTDQAKVSRYEEVMASNVDRFRRFFHGMLERGVYLAPSAFEAGFVSTVHSTADIDATLAAAEAVFANLE